MSSFLSKLVNPRRWSRLWEIQRLQLHDRYVATTTSLLDHRTWIVDTASFLSAYRAIFGDEIYAFEPEDKTPTIIDGGANIGLATLYWKKKWPTANIIAFEPDAELFEVLRWNCQSHGCEEDINLIQKGLWSETTTLQFRPDGADAGHLDGDFSTTESDPAEKNEAVSVPVVRLATFLDRPIDLLKLDIEGAETEVLLDCEGALDTVEHLFVEYHSYVDQEQRLGDLLQVLRGAGFRIHIQPELVADQPFLERLNDHNMDHRLNIFGYRP